MTMVTYLFGKTSKTLTALAGRSNVLIDSFFSSNVDKAVRCLVAEPQYKVTPDKVEVTIYYYAGNVTDREMNALGNTLSQCWSRYTKLNLVRINHSMLDRSVLAHYISLNRTKYSFNRIVDFLSSELSNQTKSSTDNTNIVGVKVDLGGRLTTQRSGPRQTTQTRRLGSSRLKTDSGSYTSKNKLGAFTVKV